MRTYHIIGLMSGSSLDGLDMAFCRFELSADGALEDWHILDVHTGSYSREWQEKLMHLPKASGRELMLAHTGFGRYMGSLLQPFLERLRVSPDLIASHGHTIFHYPDRQMTFQLGDGAALAAATGHAVAVDFRSLDVALGGQGAPLAPLADQFLLPGYDFYLNLGGIANISAAVGDRFIAFDIGGANQVLNALVAPVGLPYDDKGRMAASGTLREKLLETADNFDYYRKPYPKSLGNDWVQERLLPVYLSFDAPLPDKLHTACVQLSRRIAQAVEQIIDREGLKKDQYKMLITGGGAFNQFLTETIQQDCSRRRPVKTTIPDPVIISFKEAALIAYMGLLRLKGRPNCLASATGAIRDATGGAIYVAPEIGTQNIQGAP